MILRAISQKKGPRAAACVAGAEGLCWRDARIRHTHFRKNDRCVEADYGVFGFTLVIGDGGGGGFFVPPERR
jgi:hypothetical protein